MTTPTVTPEEIARAHGWRRSGHRFAPWVRPATEHDGEFTFLRGRRVATAPTAEAALALDRAVLGPLDLRTGEKQRWRSRHPAAPDEAAS